MKKRTISILFVLLFMLFIGIMDYPFIARMLNEMDQTAVTAEYLDTVNEITKEKKAQYLAEAVEFNRKLAAGGGMNLEVPFSDAIVQNHTYLNVLAVHEEGVMGVIEIPKISLSLPVYHGTANDVLEKGAGHLEGSSIPVGGENTHACIAAHRGLPTKKLFTNLDQIEGGDIFFIEVLGDRLAYQVYQIEIVTPDNMDSLIIQPGKDLVTLITCTPYGVNTHRIYVHGTRIPYEEAEELVIASGTAGFWQTYWWVAATVILLIWMCILLYWFNQRIAKRGENK